MQRVDRQNIYITKLNEKLTKEVNQKSRKGKSKEEGREKGKGERGKILAL